MSSSKAEYVAADGCCANILWMKSQLIDYDIIYENVPIFCDNISAIAISNNPVLHSRTKHIDIRYHFIRDYILQGDIELHFIPTQYQLDDIFTKPLDEPTFKRLIVELGGIRGDIGITTFRNALRAHYLPHLSMYVPPPSITIVRPWFATIGYSGKASGHDQISNKDAIILYCLANGVEVDYSRLIWEDIIHNLYKKPRKRPTAMGVGLRLADSHTGKNFKSYFLVMSAKDTIAVQRCGLSAKELNEFLSSYPIPSEYDVILPTSTQTIFDAPPGYVGLYTHSFSLANLRLPLTDFFCEVLQYFKVHISRLNPFGCAKLTTFIIMCKAYGCEPSVDLFRPPFFSFANLRLLP
ncbi:hypothetical protein Tco_0294258 [Tanacetum coccineum]